MRNSNEKEILFVCAHNSARFQLAEGLVNSLCKNKYIAFSAGFASTKVNPFAIDVLKEIGIDITDHFSKNIIQFECRYFDYVITVCDNAKESCPFPPGAKEYNHKSFLDTSSVEGSYEDKLNAFRKSRDEIKEWIIERILINFGSIPAIG